MLSDIYRERMICKQQANAGYLEGDIVAGLGRAAGEHEAGMGTPGGLSPVLLLFQSPG